MRSDPRGKCVIINNTLFTNMSYFIQGVYKMRSDPRGKCVIINNTLFTNMSDRGGSTFDAVNLSELFRKLHFDIDIWTDKTAKVRRVSVESCNFFRHKVLFTRNVCLWVCVKLQEWVPWKQIMVFTLIPGSHIPFLHRFSHRLRIGSMKVNT